MFQDWGGEAEREAVNNALLLSALKMRIGLENPRMAEWEAPVKHNPNKALFRVEKARLARDQRAKPVAADGATR